MWGVAAIWQTARRLTVAGGGFVRGAKPDTWRAARGEGHVARKPNEARARGPGFGGGGGETPSGDAVEPEGGEAGSGEDEHEGAGCEQLGDLLLLVREAHLGADALVDGLEVV